MEFLKEMANAVGDAFRSVWDGFVETLPAIVAGLVIIIAGWIIAALAARGLARLLRLAHLNLLAEKTGLQRFLQRAKVETDLAGILASLVKWFLILIFMVAAANTLGWVQVSQFLNEILAYLPNVAVGLIILIMGLTLASFVRDVVRGTAGSAGVAEQAAGTIAAVTYWVFVVITVLTAFSQLGIAATLSDSVYLAIFGSIGAALALAFGLGGRSLAADIMAGWSLSAHLKPGDDVKVGDDQGTVVRIGATSTVIKSQEKQVILPNSVVAQARIVH